MSEHKHTPGPWLVQFSDHDPSVLLVKPVPGRVVAQVDPIPGQEANAALIATAPELLTALQALLADVEKYGSTQPSRARKMASAAIAKATGS